MKKKRIFLFLILTVFWMGIVFGFSAENADASKETSVSFMLKIADIFDITITNKAAFESLLRSLAHFGLYLFGGVISTILFILAVPKRKYLYCVGFGIIYSLLDEIHQIFVPGRAFEIKDIIVDLTGFFIGAGLVILVSYIARKIVLQFKLH